MEPIEHKSFWHAVIKWGLIFAAADTFLTLVVNFLLIQSPSLMALFFSGIIVCLFIAFGGLFSVRQHVADHNISITIGRGALIGFVTACIIVAGSQVLSEIYFLVDSTFMQRLTEAQIAAYENSEFIPDESKRAMIDATYTQMQKGRSFLGILWSVLGGLVFTAALNALTGMVAANIYRNQ
jgi:hypothetical protein